MDLPANLRTVGSQLAIGSDLEMVGIAIHARRIHEDVTRWAPCIGACLHVRRIGSIGIIRVGRHGQHENEKTKNSEVFHIINSVHVEPWITLKNSSITELPLQHNQILFDVFLGCDFVEQGQQDVGAGRHDLGQAQNINSRMPDFSAATAAAEQRVVRTHDQEKPRRVHMSDQGWDQLVGKPRGIFGF